MKVMNKLTALSGIVLLLASCDNEEKLPTISNEDNSDYIVLKERDSHLPNEATTKPIILQEKPSTKMSGPNGEIIGNSDALLGYSYTVGNSIMGDYANVISQVIDIQKLKNIDATYITPKALSSNQRHSFAYSNFDRYEHLSNVTKKIASGFSISIGKFKFGRKKKISETFIQHDADSTREVYGELNLNIQNSAFSLDGSDGARKLYARECLSNRFMKNLYESTCGNILNAYGDFVLTGYVTGGRAFALYKGVETEEQSVEYKEKNMNSDISMSYSWDSGNASLDSLKFGKGNINITNKKYYYGEGEIQIRTYGGSHEGQAIVGPMSLSNLSLDLSPWVKSVKDVNTHTIIDVLDQGLYPMSAFVLENNFKRRFDDSSNGVLEKRTRLVTPYIEIAKVFVRTAASGEPLYEVAAVLNTRQGDKIVLSDGKAITATDSELKANNDTNVFMQKADEIVAQKRDFFGLMFQAKASIKFNTSIRNPLCIRLNQFNEKRMYKYTNTKTGMVYIYDTSSRTALSYYTDTLDGDWILDEYGIRDWIESLPTRSISMASLANSYTIIGL